MAWLPRGGARHELPLPPLWRRLQRAPCMRVCLAQRRPTPPSTTPAMIGCGMPACLSGRGSPMVAQRSSCPPTRGSHPLLSPDLQTELPCPMREGALLTKVLSPAPSNYSLMRPSSSLVHCSCSSISSCGVQSVIVAVHLVDGVVRFAAWGRVVRCPWTCSSFFRVPRFQNCCVVWHPVEVQFGAPVVIWFSGCPDFIMFSE